MKLLILGASGGCGKWLCKYAVERGHEVRALVRESTNPFEAPEGIEVVRGEALEARVLNDALEDREAVLSALGIKRSSVFPWAPVVSPPDLTERVAEILVEAMPRKGISRLIAISAAGVGDSFEVTNLMMKFLITKSNLSVSYNDLERMESVLGTSDLNWTAIRPTTLTNGSVSDPQEVQSYGTFSMIPRASVAKWMLDRVESKEEATERTPMISG